jgi:hypothetical protein
MPCRVAMNQKEMLGTIDMIGDPMKFRLKYVIEDTDRHGNVRLYYRRYGRKTRLRGPAGSPEFLSDYKEAHNQPEVLKANPN